MGLQASPEFKGIKTPCVLTFELQQLQASPEFKGIKTNSCPPLPNIVALQASPEFKGIKTVLTFELQQQVNAPSQP